MQDDGDDWEREAARMAYVYRNAYLVLGATRSYSDAQGFLGGRQNTTNASIPFRGFLLSLLPPLLQRWTTGPDPMKNEPLNSRAWCLQERCLARRMLHYGTAQVAWECAELRASKDGESIFEEDDQLSRILHTTNTGVSVFGYIVQSPWNTDIAPRRRDLVLLYSDWYRMIEHYTMRNITKDSDRLPALLGIVNDLRAISKDTYLYGIWMGGLLEGLTWCSKTNKGLEKPKMHLAPSWSWVAIKGPVEFPIYSWYEYCEGWGPPQSTLQKLAQYVGYTPDDGGLHLKAPLVSVTRICPKPAGYRESSENEPEPTTLRSSPVTDTIFCFHDEYTPLRREFSVEGVFDMRHDVDLKDQLFIVFLTRLPFASDDRLFDHRLGLIVKGKGGKGGYERIGFVDGWIMESKRLGTEELFCKVSNEVGESRAIYPDSGLKDSTVGTTAIESSLLQRNVTLI